MPDIDAVNNSSDKILRRIANYSGEYSIPFSRISFSYEDPLSFKVPYNLSIDAFINNSSEIEKALTGNHEVAHFIQLWSTTNGLLQYLYLINQQEQLAHIKSSKLYKLPLKKYFTQTILKGKEKELDPSENKFVRWYLGLEYTRINYQWLCGTVPIEELTIYKHSLIEQIPNMFYTFDFEFFNNTLDDGYGLSGKEYNLFNCLSLQREQFNQGNNIPTSIGAHHLCECFAQSVEFEHLIWFNTEIAGKIIQDWMFDDRALSYNLPYRLWLQSVDMTAKGKIGLPWAHLRVFIDLAMMYSDLLDMDVNDIKSRGFMRKIAGVKVHPGVTYFKVLQAFGKLSPLSNHTTDIFRLYDELCRELKLPSLNQMLSKLLLVVEAIMDYQIPKEAVLTRSYIEIAYRLIKEKINNPLLFINDIIYVDKLNILMEPFWKDLAIYTEKGFSERESGPSIFAELIFDISEQACVSENIECPLYRDRKICINKRRQSDICGKRNGSYFFDADCQIGNLVNNWVNNSAGLA